MENNIKIGQVNNKNDALECNKLLEKLIQSESKFNNNIDQEFKVNNWFENFYNENTNAIFIAKNNEKIIGYVYVQVTSVDDGPMKNKEALIDGLYIEEDYRAQGISKILMNKAEEWAKEKGVKAKYSSSFLNGVKYLYVNVLEENSRAVNLYKKLNFNSFEMKLKKEL